MNEREQEALRKRYMAAVESFVEKVRPDPNVMAVIVAGSLAYDVIWEKSDIDMEVIVRDQPLKTRSYCLVEDGITLNVNLAPRSGFKRWADRSIGGSFMQSYYAKGTIVYSNDDSLYGLFEELKTIGADDIALSFFHHAGSLLHCIHKGRKWLTARHDPLYAQYYVLKAAEVLAGMELCLRGEPSSRESIQKALKLSPKLLQPYYQEAMSRLYTEEELRQAIDAMDAYLERHLDLLRKPVVAFMGDQQIKSMTMLAAHFGSEGHFVVDIFDYLVEKGVIEKVSQTIRITPKSRLAVEEIGYLYIPE